jgi:bacteriorhodopsin
MTLMLRGNDALNVNPLANADETLSLHGSDWLWAVTAIYIVAFVSCSSALNGYLIQTLTSPMVL